MNNQINQDTLVESMNHNIKEYRYQLSKELQIKYVPRIKFYYDNTFEEKAEKYGRKMAVIYLRKK